MAMARLHDAHLDSFPNTLEGNKTSEGTMASVSSVRMITVFLLSRLPGDSRGRVCSSGADCSCGRVL